MYNIQSQKELAIIVIYKGCHKLYIVVCRSILGTFMALKIIRINLKITITYDTETPTIRITNVSKKKTFYKLSIRIYTRKSDKILSHT